MKIFWLPIDRPGDYALCTEPAARLLNLKQTGNGWLATCLGSTKMISQDNIHLAQREAVLWFLNLLTELETGILEFAHATKT